MNIEYTNIIDAIRLEVKRIKLERWKDDGCPPKFWVSVMYNYDKEDSQDIILTVKHLGSTISKKIFPTSNLDYGYDSLLNIMESLYNQTM